MLGAGIIRWLSYYLDPLTGTLSAGIVPHSWMKYTIPPGLTVLQWVTDFSKRIEQLQRLSSAVSKNGAKIVRVS